MLEYDDVLNQQREVIYRYRDEILEGRDMGDVAREEIVQLIDRLVADLPSLLQPGDLVVANDTRVIPAQLTGFRGDARIGITRDRMLPDGSWHVLVRNARRLRENDVLRFEGSAIAARVLSREPGGAAVLRFAPSAMGIEDEATGHLDAAAFDSFLREVGRLALPPYIARPDGPTTEKNSPRARSRSIGPSACNGGLVSYTRVTPRSVACAGASSAVISAGMLLLSPRDVLPTVHRMVSAHRLHGQGVGPHEVEAGPEVLAVGGARPGSRATPSRG